MRIGCSGGELAMYDDLAWHSAIVGHLTPPFPSGLTVMPHRSTVQRWPSRAGHPLPRHGNRSPAAALPVGIRTTDHPFARFALSAFRPGCHRMLNQGAIDCHEPQTLDLTLRQKKPIEWITRQLFRFDGGQDMMLVDRE